MYNDGEFDHDSVRLVMKSMPKEKQDTMYNEMLVF